MDPPVPERENPQFSPPGFGPGLAIAEQPESPDGENKGSTAAQRLGLGGSLGPTGLLRAEES